MKSYALRVSQEITLVPILHYSVESAATVAQFFQEQNTPDAIAIECPEICHEAFLQAVHRLPDLSCVRIQSPSAPQNPSYIPIEPCDPLVEACRQALDRDIPLYSIDLFVENYPLFHDSLVDPYTISVLGLQKYIELSLFQPSAHTPIRSLQDETRENAMAQRIFELSLRHGNVTAFIGLHHLYPLAQKIQKRSFLREPSLLDSKHTIDLITYPEGCERELLKTPGYVTKKYEAWRNTIHTLHNSSFDPLLIYSDLLEEALQEHYPEPAQLPRMIAITLEYMKRLSRIRGFLLGETRELIESSQGILGQKAGYLVWKLATEYPYLKNIDALPELPLKPQELWGSQTTIRFHPIIPSKKTELFQTALRHEKSSEKFFFPTRSLCSYPPEDNIVESFGKIIKKRGLDLLCEASKKILPFTTSLEDGIHIRETLKQRIGKIGSSSNKPGFYVEKKEFPAGKIGSCVVIFHEDSLETLPSDYTMFPWAMTWQGEHSQESDMAFYATTPMKGIIGPGIARCRYGGFLLSYPPRRMYDVWHDRDYQDHFLKRQDILLAAGIDYSLEPLIIYTAPTAPSHDMIEYARMRGKKVLFLPLNRFSQKRLTRLQLFHVLDSKERRTSAEEYINDILNDERM